MSGSFSSKDPFPFTSVADTIPSPKYSLIHLFPQGAACSPSTFSTQATYNLLIHWTR